MSDDEITATVCDALVEISGLRYVDPPAWTAKRLGEAAGRRAEAQPGPLGDRGYGRRVRRIRANNSTSRELAGTPLAEGAAATDPRTWIRVMPARDGLLVVLFSVSYCSDRSRARACSLPSVSACGGATTSRGPTRRRPPGAVVVRAGHRHAAGVHDSSR